MKRIVTAIVGTLMLLMFAGCASTSSIKTNPDGTVSTNKFDIHSITPFVRAAAFGGTVYALGEQPGWADKFALASSDLKDIEKAPEIDFNLLINVVERLPVPALRSEEAKLSITGARILLLGYQDRLIKLNELSSANVREVARAMHEGIDAAIAAKSKPAP
jgi:hypothetical protein